MKGFKKIVAVLLVCFAVAPAFALDNWMSTTFQYEHLFNTALRTDGESDSLGFDVGWHTFADHSFAGFFARSGFEFSVDGSTGLNPFLFTINTMMGPAFKVDINDILTWYVGVGPSLSQSSTLSGTYDAELMFGVGADTGLRISLQRKNTSGIYLEAGVMGTFSFLHVKDSVASNRLSGSIVPYFGFCFSYSTYPYDSYYVYNPLFY